MPDDAPDAAEAPERAGAPNPGSTSEPRGQADREATTDGSAGEDQEQRDDAQSAEAVEVDAATEPPTEAATDVAGQSTAPADEPEVEAADERPTGVEPEPEPDTAPAEGSASDEADAARGGSEADDEPATKTVTVTIDDYPHEARPGQLVIDACEDAGQYVPRFCYHPRMTPVGMCRQCLVEVEGPRGPMMVVSCMTPVADGQVVRTATPEIKRAQEGVLELLLANHPLDCPVCDKGGECPLQDQAFSHGPGESRYLEEKRHFEKPIAISDLVFLDRERCILCDRCTRFADEVAGDPLITFTHRGNETQVLTFPDEPFASYFSGNTVQICPVGALTASPYRFKARPWDLDQVESTCTTCSVGCRIVVQSSRDQLVRYQGVDSDPVNWGWLCDRGRFNFEAVSSDQRLGAPLVRGEGGPAETSWSTALQAAAQLLQAADPAAVAVLGGARGTNEDAYAWARLADALGVARRDAQLGDGLRAELLDLPRATIDQAAAAATVVLVGPDLKEELPILYLRLRHAAEQRATRLVELSPIETGLTPYAWRSIRVEAGGASAAAAALRDDAVAEQLASGPVVIVAGRANLAESEASAMATLRAVLDACPGATVLPALRRGNVVGALQLGLRPRNGDGALAVLADAAEGRVDCLVLLGADPLADCPDADLARRGLAGARSIIAVDTFRTGSTEQADVVLAAAAFGEKAGTTTNLEGRVSGVARKVTPAGTSRPDWMIAAELADLLGHQDVAAELSSVDAVTTAIAATVPGYAAATVLGVAADRDGVLAVPPGSGAPLEAGNVTVADRNRYDYRVVMSRRLYDRAAGTAMSPSLAPLAPSSAARVNPLDLDRIGVADGAEVQVIGTRGAVVLPLAADATVPRGTLAVTFNVAGSALADIIDATAPVTDVRVERL